MKMYTKDRRGSALVLVLVASIFLIILTAGAFRYFQTNVDTQIWARDRVQAKLSAEAGINLATHMLIAGAALPAGVTTTPFLGTEFSFFDLPGDMGSVYVSVNPSDNNSNITSANAYDLWCIANVPGVSFETFGMESIVMPENLARFSVFMDNPSTDGAYVDGYRFDGPFYANGPVRVYSTSATHENDPFFYSFSLTSNYYLAVGTTHQTSPTDGGNLQMRPYNRLSMGAPYFELGVDPIPFGEDELDWEGVRNAASTDGLYLTTAEVPDGSRLALKGDTLFVKTAPLTVATAYYLGDLVNPVVWIENGNSDRIFLRSNQDPDHGLNMALTIGTQGPVYMSGKLIYENMDLLDPDNENLLGIMTVNGDLVIADDPDVEEPDWGGEMYQIATDNDFRYCAVIVALEGDLVAEDLWEPAGPQEFGIVGGYMIQEEGYTSTNSSGFDITVYFDPRLLYMHPPFFPTTANWRTTMWAERPDITPEDVSSGDIFY